jgi:hypothetical protein
MNYDLRDADIATVLAEASLVAAEVRRAFGALAAEQLNWKPDAREWSIAQCLDHLILSNRPYVPIFEDLLAGRRRGRLRERVPVLPRLFGSLLLNTLRPDSGRKVQARRPFLPSASALPPAIVATFVEEHERLQRLMEASRGLDIADIVITSPVLGLITYSLLDACRIIVAHEQNHFVQATRVGEASGFPSRAQR